MKVARAKGRVCGKQPKLSPTQEAHLVSLYAAGEHEELFSITRSNGLPRDLSQPLLRATT